MKAFEVKDEAPIAEGAQGRTDSAPPKRRGIVLMAVGGVVVLAFLAALGARVKQATEKKAALGQERTAAQAAAATKPVAKTTKPEPVRYRPFVEVTGSLQPWRNADIGFEQGGRLLRVNAAVGDKVKSGTVLAVLDGKTAYAQVSQTQASARAAEASLAMAEDNLRRSEALVQSKAIPEAQAEQSRQQVALARAQLEASRASAQMAGAGAVDRSILAPFDGLITKAPTSAGGVVSPGVVLIRIEDHSRFRLSVSVSEDDASLVKPGAKVDITMRDRNVEGKITTVVPSLDQGTRRAPVEIEVANVPSAPLLAWSFVRAKIDSGTEVAALKIPSGARRPGSQTEIVKLENGRAKFARVVRGTDDQGNWLVREGLAATDVVIVNADPELKDGDVVEKSEPQAVSNK